VVFVEKDKENDLPATHTPEVLERVGVTYLHVKICGGRVRGVAEWWVNMSALREQRGISQKALADAVGVSPQRISDWANGREVLNPELKTLRKIAAGLGVSVGQLLDFEPAETGGLDPACHLPTIQVPNEVPNAADGRSDDARLYARLYGELVSIYDRIGHIIDTIPEPRVGVPSTNSSTGTGDHRPGE
jgi:transcriptional regulator with XRE-family HTH domain